MNESIVKSLNLSCKNYDAVTKTVVMAKNRLSSLMPDSDIHGETIKGLESIKDKISRNIRRELEMWPIWTEWMEKVPGIGPFIAGNLIILYYYKLVPICKDCGGEIDTEIKEANDQGVMLKTYECKDCKKKAKGDGRLSHAVIQKDFPNASKWWSYMGRACDETTGLMRKRKAGIQSNWSSKGRTTGFHIWQGFNKQKEDHPYKAYMIGQKTSHVKKNPTREKEWTPLHIMNAAGNETAKLFLSHFWHVARFLEGKSTDGLYIKIIGKHTGIIPPYYWTLEKELAKEAA